MQKKKRARTRRLTSKNGTSPLQSKLISELTKKIEKLNEWRRRLSVLLKYGKRATTTTSLDELLMLLVEEAKVVLNAERATVFLVDKKNQLLWSKVALGTEPIRIPLERGIAGSVAMTGQLLNIKDVYKDSRFNP